MADRMMETGLWHARTLSTLSVTADTTLGKDNSGRVILMGTNGVDIILPPCEVGLNFKIIQTGNFDTAACTIKTSVQNTEFFVGGYASADSGDGNTSDNDSNDVITFGSATLAGDYLDLVCISATQWHAVGFAKSSDNSNAIVFSDA